MIVTVSARCERLPMRPRRLVRCLAIGPASVPPYTPGPPPIHPHPVVWTPPARRGFSQPSFAVPGAVRGGSPGSAAAPGVCLTTAYSTVDNFAGNVDGEAAESFFLRTGRGRHQRR